MRVRRTREKSYLSISGAATLTAIVIMASLGFSPGLARGSGPVGPVVSVQVLGWAAPPHSGLAPLVGSPLSNVWVDISSVDPHEAMGGDTPTVSGSSGVLDLFSGWTGSSGTVAGNLGAGFLSLAAAWSSLAPPTVRPSLTLHAILQFPVGSSLDVYTYYDALPYNPITPGSPLSAQVRINLGAPTYVTPTPLCIPNGSGGCVKLCPPGGQYVQVLNTSYRTGPFPLAMTFDNATGNPDFLNLGLFSINQQESFSFTGASFTQGASFAEFGTSPTFSLGGTYVQLTGGTVTANSQAATAVGILYVYNVTLFTENWRYVDFYFTGQPPACVEHFEYGNINTDIQIAGMQLVSGDMEVLSQTLPATWAYLVSRVLNLQPANQPIPLGSGHSYGFLTGQFLANGYSNMNSVFNQVVNGLSYFTSALGLGLAIMDAASLCPFGACEAVELGETLGLITSELGLETSIIQSMTTISWSETLSTSLQAELVTNDQVGSGQNMHITFYQAATPQTQAECGANNPVANMPVPFVTGTN